MKQTNDVNTSFRKGRAPNMMLRFISTKLLHNINRMSLSQNKFRQVLLFSSTNYVHKISTVKLKFNIELDVVIKRTQMW